LKYGSSFGSPKKSPFRGPVRIGIYTQQEHDTNTGLIYFGARYYDPDTARFITQDPYLGENTTPPSLHRYLYAYSNPTVYVDLNGYASVVEEKGKVYWGALRSKGDALPHYKWHEIGVLIEKDGAKYVHLTKEFGDGTVKLARLNIAARNFEEDSKYSESDLYYFEEERREFIINAYIDFKVNPHNKAWISAIPEKSFFDEYINPLDDLHQDLLLVNAGVMRPDDFAGKYAFETLIGLFGSKVGVEFLKRLKGPLLKILEKHIGKKIDDVIEEGFERAPKSAPKVTQKGISRIEQHLKNIDALDHPPNQAMLQRLKSGKATQQDIKFYLHEAKESTLMKKGMGARDAHLKTLEWQKIPYEPGYESQLYRPGVIQQYSEHFNPAAWPK